MAADPRRMGPRPRSRLRHPRGALSRTSEAWAGRLAFEAFDHPASSPPLARTSSSRATTLASPSTAR
eukprot:11221096-Lingulodinium_polyedra.AAC.1